MSEDPTKKDQSWLLPSVRKNTLHPGLYLVATPIGNMGDMSFRALDVLAGADLVACEDTRVSGKLLSYYGLSKTLVSYNDHSDEARRSQIVEAVRGGGVVALVSDAGMPMVSDPGYKLVRAFKDEGLRVNSVPGANAPLAALQLSGFPSDQFSFLGFLPSKQAARRDVLQRWVGVPGTLIAFETAPRLLKALADIADVMGAREVAVVREITKLHEEVRSGAAAELIAYYEREGAPKGEIVLVIAPAVEEAASEVDLEDMLRAALETMSTKDAAAYVAKQSGAAKKALYAMALEISKDG